MRILIVADFADWILGVWGQKIIQHHPEYEFDFIARAICFDDKDIFPELAMRADLVYFMSPHYLEWYPLTKSIPVITSVHHFVTRDHIQAALDADLVCYMADSWKHELLSLGVAPERLAKFTPGVDTASFHPAASCKQDRKRLGFRESDFVVGFFAKKGSNECDRKNSQAAFEIIKRLSRDTGKSIKLLLTGPGWSGEDFACIKANVTYLPFVDVKKMPHAYRALNVYLITSTVEGGPVPLLEAMASGVPVVSTRCGFAPEIIKHETNGFLVDDVVHDGVRYIRVLMESEALRREISSNARETIERSRTWVQMVSPFPGIVGKAIDNYKSRSRPACSRISFAQYERVFSDHWHWPNITHENPVVQQQTAVAYDRYLWREQLFKEGNRRVASKMALSAFWGNMQDRSLFKQYLGMLRRQMLRT